MTARGFGVAAATPPDVVEAAAVEAERAGYASFWINHPGSMDALGVLEPAAAATSAIELGVGVVPLHQREPRSILDGIAEHALPRDRLLLGVGSPNPQALDRVRRGVAELRTELPRVVVAAIGPRMCRLAGEVADGVLFNWLTPGHARRSAGWVREGAEAAGRPAPRLFAYVRLALGPDARERVAEEGARYQRVPWYGAHFERMGAAPEETAITGDVEAALREWEGAVDEVVLRALAREETPDEYLALVAAGSG